MLPRVRRPSGSSSTTRLTCLSRVDSQTRGGPDAPQAPREEQPAFGENAPDFLVEAGSELPGNVREGERAFRPETLWAKLKACSTAPDFRHSHEPRNAGAPLT
jgi:hypothetical protein